MEDLQIVLIYMVSRFFFLQNVGTIHRHRHEAGSIERCGAEADVRDRRRSRGAARGGTERGVQPLSPEVDENKEPSEQNG